MSIDELLDYLAGLVVGDGDLYHRKRKGEYRIRISDSSKEFLESVSKLIRKTLSINTKIYKHRKYNCFILTMYSKNLFFELRRRITANIEKPSIAFVRGLLDAEGGVSKSVRGSIRIHFTNKDVRLINSYVRVLNNLGIKYYVTKTGSKYKVFVQNKENTCKLISMLNPLHPKIKLKYQNLTGMQCLP